MKPRAAIVVLIAAVCAGCVKQDEVYAPPYQRRPLAGPDTSRLKHFVAMNDPDAPAHFVRDINERLESGLWRWTAQHPRLRFVLPRNPGRLKLVMDFTIPGDVIKQTGPLTVKFFLNQRDLETVTFAQPGEQHKEWPVDPSWLSAEDYVLGADLSKVFVGGDGAQLGLALVRAGFVN
ncbi:MAG: hypothetical protein IT162_05550 [Bryobacterales bacterium]|nr:hypothetical protein [Bryobacterales bacterium]